MIFVCAHQKQNQCRDEKHDQNRGQVHFPEINDIGKIRQSPEIKETPKYLSFWRKVHPPRLELNWNAAPRTYTALARHIRENTEEEVRQIPDGDRET
ncbi:hypothetical protein [Aminivibrio sp.]|uniref:hypothetical protein n=1 Tax=Aminivibrio sp. TaxID=1872489 RepID=UPI00345E758E